MLWTDREISFFHFLLWEVLGVLWKWDFLSFPITINCNLFSYLDDAVDWWINSGTSVAGMLSNKYCSSIHILLGICRIQYQALETSANLPAEEDPTFEEPTFEVKSDLSLEFNSVRAKWKDRVNIKANGLEHTFQLFWLLKPLLIQVWHFGTGPPSALKDESFLQPTSSVACEVHENLLIFGQFVLFSPF